jgi:hypothetical protein
MKKCKKCGLVKKFTEFYKHKETTDGFYGACKKCRNAHNAKWQNRNKDKVKISRKKYYTKNKENFILYINKHNKSKDFGLYSIFWSMQRRCKYPSQKNYKYYGGKGITVEWKSYQEFKRDMFTPYRKHLKKYGRRQTTIDRIDSDKNYCKDNCRWATYKIQANNKKVVI